MYRAISEVAYQSSHVYWLQSCSVDLKYRVQSLTGDPLALIGLQCVPRCHSRSGHFQLYKLPGAADLRFIQIVIGPFTVFPTLAQILKKNCFEYSDLVLYMVRRALSPFLKITGSSALLKFVPSKVSLSLSVKLRVDTVSSRKFDFML